MSWAPLTRREIEGARQLQQARHGAEAVEGIDYRGPDGDAAGDPVARSWERSRARQDRGDRWRLKHGARHSELPAPLGAAPSRKDCHQCNPCRTSTGADAPLLHRAPTPARDWQPTAPFEPRAARAALYRLRQGIRPLGRTTGEDRRGRDCSRIAVCGYALSADAHQAGAVGIVASPSGSCRYDGVVRCGSVHECPVCAAAIRTKRADELRELVGKHGGARTVLLTLTISHHCDDLGTMIAGLANAWRAVCRGKPWQRFKQAIGLSGYVRALDVTHGGNGWHPHLHVLLLLDEPIEDRDVFDGEWLPPFEMSQRGKLPQTARGWLIERWQTMVARYLGDRFLPDDQHGLSLRPSPLAAYVAKLGCELTDPFAAKRGRKGSRTPFQIAADWCDTRRARDAQLWRHFCAAIKGHRQLTWSRGLKDRYGLRERPDHDLTADEEPTNDDQLVAQVSADDWRAVRCTYIPIETRGKPLRQSAASWLLEQIEQGGARALSRALAIIHEKRARQEAARERR